MDRFAIYPVNRNAIFFSISENLCFAVANVIMQLNKYSGRFMRETDILIYNNGISLEQKILLKKLHPYIFFEDIQFPEEWKVFLQKEKLKKYGVYIYSKFWFYKLIHEYEKILFLDVDMEIRADIAELFDPDEEMIWRNVLAWDARENFAKVLKKPDDYISTGNGGLYYFNGVKLRKYNIGFSDFIDAYEKVKDLHRGGYDETILAWIVYDKGIQVEELDDKIWNTPARRETSTSKLVHFLPHKNIETKPWKSLASYLYFDEWRENYQRWIDMGGEGPINWTKEDYHELFAFDKARKIEKLTKENKQLKEELKQTKEEFESEKAKSKSFKQKLSAIKNSKSWRITKPLRYIMKLLKKLKP